MRIVVLAAGVGSRLGNSYPKPLTPLGGGETILGRQLRLLGDAFDPTWVCVVVGFKKELIMEAFPDVLFAYNREYGDTNTSKSLLRALTLTKAEPVLWLNGDVVFDPGMLDLVADGIAAGGSFVCVNTARVSDEEVKYAVGDDGAISEISKAVASPLGEAVGVNFVSAADKPALARRLEECDPQDYFERGIELAIAHDGLKVMPLDISEFPCIEVDFREDLEQARRRFG